MCIAKTNFLKLAASITFGPQLQHATPDILHNIFGEDLETHGDFMLLASEPKQNIFLAMQENLGNDAIEFCYKLNFVYNLRMKSETKTQ